MSLFLKLYANHAFWKIKRGKRLIYHEKKPQFMKMKKKSKKLKDDFRRELESYVKDGVTLWLDGSPSTPKKIDKAHKMAEGASYMRDYVQDADGRLSRLEFDRIKDR